MKIAKINEKEYCLRFNIGSLRRTAKRLGLTTPQIFEKLTENDMDVVVELLYQCIINTHKDFDIEILDELSISEFNEVVVILAEVISEGMPEADKKTMKKKK
ncbi:hypothetical protein [Clostridium saudiense]|jgi:hypothetical protein|nr:hypothetical protein [Clostridium saudiense]